MREEALYEHVLSHVLPVTSKLQHQQLQSTA